MDLANSDCIIIQGSNFAENHPVGFRFVMQAKARGATIIHVDPRFSRTSALADLHVPLRAGSDIAFLGGLINYVLANDRWFREYVLAYTNAATLVRADFVDTEDLDGLFSGYDAEACTYDPETWAYRREGLTPNPSPSADGEGSDHDPMSVPLSIRRWRGAGVRPGKGCRRLTPRSRTRAAS